MPPPGDATAVSGVAATFNVLAHYSDGPGGPRVACYVCAGAFDRSLHLARTGVSPIRLLFDHDRDDVLADTADGSLMLYADRKSLNFMVQTHTARGREAVRRVAASGMRECSVGGRLHEYAVRLDGVGVMCVARVDLGEISVVGRGGNPRTRVVVHYPRRLTGGGG